MAEDVTELTETSGLVRVAEVDSELFDRLAFRRTPGIRIFRVEAPTRKSQMARPGIRVVIRTPDEKRFEI
jgi:hypothetical protein